MHGRYNAETGDVVVGRVTEVGSFKFEGLFLHVYSLKTFSHFSPAQNEKRLSNCASLIKTLLILFCVCVSKVL